MPVEDNGEFRTSYPWHKEEVSRDELVALLKLGHQLRDLISAAPHDQETDIQSRSRRVKCRLEDALLLIEDDEDHPHTWDATITLKAERGVLVQVQVRSALSTVLILTKKLEEEVEGRVTALTKEAIPPVPPTTSIEELHQQTQADAKTAAEARDLANKTASKIAKQLKDTERELAQLKSNYDLGIRTEAPASYWDNEAKRHKVGMVIWGILALVVFVGALGVITFAAERYVAADTPGQSIAVLGALVVALLVVLRVLARRFESHAILMDDSTRRKLLVDTFIMLPQDNANAADERILLLHALFRAAPSLSTRPVPDTPHEQVIKMISAESKRSS